MPSATTTVVGVAAVSLSLVLMLMKIIKNVRRVNLEGKVVVITGASSGLGEACACAFYKAGAKVILCSRRLSELERVKKSLTELQCGSGVVFTPVCVQLDLADLQRLPEVAQHILEVHGHIDVLVNNAGISYRGDVASTDIAVDQRVMNVNYFGQVALTKAFLPHMIGRGSGHLVAVSSIQGRVSIPFRSAYSASKHALQAFFDCLRAEMCDKGIRVSVVSPGYIQTQLSVNAVTADGSSYGVMDQTTAGGMAPSSVARAVLDCVRHGEPDVILAPCAHRLVITLRSVWPGLYFYIMNRRARKQGREVEKRK